MSRIPKKVLVTGAQGALGDHVVRRFLEAGCEVVGVDRKLQDPSRYADRPRIQWVEVDLTDPEALRAKVPADVEAWIHCAGGFRYAKVDELEPESLEFLLDANVRSAFLLAKHLLPGMKQRGFGRIIFVGARATESPGAGMGAYAASKAGINMLVSSLADEVRALDINVNAVLPSIIDTPANRRDMPQANFAAWVNPGELAEILFSLTQPWGRPIHGALIPVSGRV